MLSSFIVRALQRLTILLRVMYVFLAGIVILVLSSVCLWLLPQGLDIIMKEQESGHASGLVLMLVLFFWAYVSWYSGRIIAYRKNLLANGALEKVAPVLMLHMPRLLAYLCFTITAMAILQCPQGLGKLSGGWLLALLGIYIVLYFLLTHFMDRWGGRLRERHQLFRLCGWLLASIFAAILVCGYANTLFSLVAGICWMQLASLFLMVNRRKLHFTATREVRGSLFTSLLKWVLRGDDSAAAYITEEALLFTIFNCVSGVAALCYFAAVFYLPFANATGSFPFALLAFGILLGFFNFMTIASILSSINFGVVFLLLLVIAGFLFEPHNIRISHTPGSTERLFDKRQGLEDFFVHWLQQRSTELRRDSIYPVFFVLADGGASRSGYWTAAVLSRLEEGSRSRFSRHLFCLSGASGGSVGNGTFFCLLQLQDSIYRAKHTLLQEARQYLRADFLTYTLARMIGPDFFRPLFPFPFVYDRAAALEYAVEHAAPDSLVMSAAFRQKVSGIIAAKNDSNYRLPILCINTTRMQDGTPGLVSNIDIDSATFGKRIDVLDLLGPGEDINLSTAVILGARFPYVSPAGRIRNSYFVDGGYFDNSGAGAVHEMILQLNQWAKDSAWLQRHPALDGLQPGKKLKWYVIHITNSSQDTTAVHKVHPIVNDLFAPVETLLGSYGTQTVVNNLRLIRYLGELNKDTSYFPINLYEKNDTNQYTMNWVISDTTLRKMDYRLAHYPRLDSLVYWIRNNFNLPAGEISSLGK